MSRVRSLDVVREIAKNAAMGIPPVRAARLRRPRAGTTFVPTDEVLERYAFQALRTLQRHCGTIKGRSVVEFGPGDTLASGIALLAAGAAGYAVLDRFVPDYSAPEAKAWYHGINREWARHFPDLPWPGWLDPSRFPESFPDRVTTISGSVEQAQAGRQFDVVCSFQVGEHVSDVTKFASLTAELLAPGGVAVHRVDFGPHDCWLNYDDPLTFLRFQPWLWSAMGSNRGTANRKRHHEYVEAFEAVGLRVECVDRAVYPKSSVDLGRLHRDFRHAEEQSVLTSNVVYLCRR